MTLPRADARWLAQWLTQDCPPCCPFRSMHHEHKLNPNGSYRIEVPGVELKRAS